MNNAMLDLFRDRDKIHVITASGRAFHLSQLIRDTAGEYVFHTYLQVIPIVLVEALQTLYE